MAHAQNWFEKGRGSWPDSAPEQTEEQASQEVQSDTSSGESSLSDAEDNIVTKTKSDSNYDQELARRKAAAAKARAAVKSADDDLTNLESAPAEAQKKVDSELLPVKQKAAQIEEAPQQIEEAPKKIKRAAKKRASRHLSSLESSEDSLDAGSSETKVRVRRKKQHEQGDLFRMGILSGIASIASADGSSGGSLLNIALQADYQSKYWGAELDGYYGLGLGLSASGTSASGLSQSQYGLFIGPKFNYSFGSGDFRFVPKVGVGYGMMALSAASSSTTSGVSTSATVKSNIAGIYAMGGFDVFFTRWMYVSADYSTSVSASGKIDANLNGVSASQTVDGAKFARIRAGLNFILAQHLILGGEYYSRSITVNGQAAPQNFVMGHLGYQF